ncbi:glycosyl hydrolase family 28-related protein [Parapedobacter sp. DT-150]|uniref:glycosyl hydrolase family 28-related protein n=1 Tax=Parapedobacter sp. DT-150 TaxID=3396162 RepID=UPI003F1C915B
MANLVGNTIVNNFDRFTGEPFNAEKVTVWADGTIMDDSKVDNVMYFKVDTGIGGGYAKRTYTGPANVKWFGARGDGIADDTDAINLALSSPAGSLFLESGTYIVNSPILVEGGKELIGEGPTLKPGVSAIGDLATWGTVIRLSGGKNIISGIKIDVRGLTQSQTSKYVIRMMGATENQVSHIDVFVNDELTPTTEYNQAIDVNSGCIDNKITDCRIYGAGIRYTASGAIGTLVERCLIINASANGMTANGNAAEPVTGHILKDNTLRNCNRMGIEDYGDVLGTIITGNVIDNVGVLEHSMCISAVGNKSIVSGNILSGFTEYGIENAGNSGNVVTGNIITGTAGIGIIANLTIDMQNIERPYGNMVICSNSIEGPTYGIRMFGNVYDASVTITSNVLNNCRNGITIESLTSNSTSAMIVGNSVYYKGPDTVGARIGLRIVTGTTTKVIISGNSIVFHSDTGGNFQQSAISFSSEYCVITNNFINGNAVTSGGGPVRFWSSGAASPNSIITENIVIGATTDLNGLESPYMMGNLFDTLNQGSRQTISFFNGSRIAKQSITATTAGQAISNLLTTLSAYGLITNQTAAILAAGTPSVASADTATAPSAAYNQTEVQAILDELRDLKTKMRAAGLLDL